jgi:hypothetical protein
MMVLNRDGQTFSILRYKSKYYILDSHLRELRENSFEETYLHII